MLDQDYNPLGENLNFIEKMNKNYLISEVGASQLEINSDYFTINDDVLTNIEADLQKKWNACLDVIKTSDTHLILIGSPPTATEDCHSYEFLTNKSRYFILDSCMSQSRQTPKIELNIQGKDTLKTSADCLAMNGLTASFQMHMRVGLSQSVAYYNASQIISAAIVGACCNSPFLFGHDLWSETRIAVFEQVMTLKALEHPEGFNCCLFGTNYLSESFYELYEQNYNFFPRLLPLTSNETEPEEMHHVRMQNGTVYRWNRPVLGFDDGGGVPHLRIEHRPISAGPSIVDMVANASLFYGLMNYYATACPAPEVCLPFFTAKENFYRAAKNGLNAEITWINGTNVKIKNLMLDVLLNQAYIGLQNLKIDKEQSQYFLSIIKERVKKQRTGSQWQLDWVARYGRDYHKLTEVYLLNQASGLPIHEWGI